MNLSLSAVLLASLPMSLPFAPLSEPASLAPAPPLTTGIQYFGDAYGSYATVGSVVKAGRSFPVTLGSCGTLRTPASKRNTGATVNARPFAVTGAIDTSIAATDVPGTQATRTTATVHSVSLLSGLITADEVRAVSLTSRDGSSFHTSGEGSRAVNLRIANVSVLAAPAPNTRVDLPGLGYAILNEQRSSIGPASASLIVNMIHVVVTLPNLLVPVGTDLTVAHANSGLAASNITGTLDGFAYGSIVRQGPAFLSGPSALVILGCQGTNGELRENDLVGANAAPHFYTDVLRNTATGVVSSTSASGETTSTVEALDLLSSLVTADVIKADARSFTDGGTFTFTDQGSAFVNLSVRGFPEIRDDVPPNTHVSVAGLGTLWLKREITTPNSIEVRMIQLEVTQVNVYGIPVGTDIRVAVAHASAH